MTPPERGRRARATAKAELRAEMRRLRDAVPLSERARRGRLIEERLAGLESFREARSVLLFSSFGSEVATTGLLRRAEEAGKRVLLPYMDGTRLEAAAVTSQDELVPTDYGAREPPRRDPIDPRDLDLVVTPGLAFDRRGHRLGYGRGYYDRYLARLRPDAVRAAIAFGFQVVVEVPAGPGDERVHLVVTEDETIACP